MNQCNFGSAVRAAAADLMQAKQRATKRLLGHSAL
jgi:hypothetical protein